MLVVVAVNYYYVVRIILYLYLFIHTYIYPLKFFWLNLQIINYDENIERLSSEAAEFNNIPYPIMLNYWKKKISTTLQIGNASIISEVYRRLFNFGAETIQRDFDVERTFH